MSLFEFIASDKLLDDVKNPYFEYLSLNDAIERNIVVADNIMTNKDEKIIMLYESPEHPGEISIRKDMFFSSGYAREYSNKKYFSEFFWSYTEIRAKQLIDYLNEQLKSTDEIEIWSIWMDEHKTATIKTVNANELSITDLAFIDTSNGYEKPKCLIIKK